MKIGINCGHTVSGQPGCGTVGFIDESVETRNVGRALINLLTHAGHIVYDCTNDYAPSTSSNLTQIVDMANAHPLDLFISIHFNAGGGKGVEVYTYGGESLAEATNACKKLEALGFENRGVKDGSSLAVVRRTNAKAMLVEVCFTDTETDVELYKKIGSKAIAAAIAEAITCEATIEEKGESDMERLNKLEKGARANETDNDMIYDYIDENMPKWAHEPVQWCVDKGVIVGADNEGKLHLTYNKLWTCVVVYRAIKVLAKLMNIKI